MTTQQIADRLVELCQKADYETCYAELYSPEIISHEAKEFGGATTVGIEGIKENGKKWNENIAEMHSGFTNPAIVAGNSFACTMGFDATMKDGSRLNMAEVAVYKVADGKIVEEWFFV